MGTNYKSIAQKKLEELEKLKQQHAINPFHPDFDIDEALGNNKEDFPYTLQEAKEKFLATKQHLKAASIDFYTRNIDHFFSHQDIANLHPGRLSSEKVENFLFRGGISADSIHANARGLKSFFNYMMDKRWIDRNPLDKINLPEKKVSYHKKMLTIEEFHKLFKTFDEHQAKISKEKWYRTHHRQDWFKPLIATYFYTGMRLHEAAYSPKLDYSGLKGLNIMKDCSVFYLGPTKREKERYIPISKKLRPFLLDYFQIRGWPTQNEYVFIHEGGRYDGMPVRGKAAREAFNEYCDKANIDKTKTMHGMRHSRITQWIRDGFSVAEAAQMAGNSIEVTANVYTHLAYEPLIEKMKRLEADD
ncbi:tyrosine-type recombinase/integrase [Gracilimonas tropica]|uniref:tyrosine-type recombinase/integrase n=1 Tax=Gracilimonas tropica TaxID=454600 RepID=UPI0014613AB2|nr:site-specific integrase [Gracilimonas tropica]